MNDDAPGAFEVRFCFIHFRQYNSLGKRRDKQSERNNTWQPGPMKFFWEVLRTTYEYLVLYLALLYFALVGVAYTIVCTMLYPLLPRRPGRWFARRGIGLLFRSYLAMLRFSGLLKLDLSALDELRAEEGIIVAPNHPSLLDAVLIISRLPDIACIMKAGIRDSLILGGGARLAGYIRNDYPANMVRQAARELRSGQQLLVFPEGTRTQRPPVNPFKGGFALIAKQSAAPLQTVFIESNSPFLSKGWPILKKPKMPLSYRAQLGERFEFSGDTREFVNRLETYYRRKLEADSAATASDAREHPLGHSATAS